MTQNKKARIVPRKVPFGVLVYEQPDGQIFGDGEGRDLHLFINDINNQIIREIYIKRLIEAAIDYGADEGGRVLFMPGRRPVTDDTYDDMMEAITEGKPIPGDWHDEDIDGSRH